MKMHLTEKKRLEISRTKKKMRRGVWKNRIPSRRTMKPSTMKKAQMRKRMK